MYSIGILYVSERRIHVHTFGFWAENPPADLYSLSMSSADAADVLPPPPHT